MLMTTDQIRSKFLDFMKTKGHAVVPSAPVFLKDDSSTLFTSAGMQPMVPYLLGKPHSQGKRIADVQKCIRTVDIDEVGDNRHLTMFEMLGNWSLGDYYKQDSIAWSWEFMTSKEWLGLDPEMIYITVYEGDNQVPKDDESIEIWRQQFAKVNIDVNKQGRIQTRGADDNWWALGPVGPCGPDTEIFYYIGKDKNPKFEDTDEFIEVWNNVFMVYDRDVNGKLTDLPAKNVDTGMGLERTAAIIQGVDTVFETDLLKSIGESVLKSAGKSDQISEDEARAARIITDHLRSGVFMAGDGVVPSNTERGYIMRRLLRRAIRQGLVLGIDNDLCPGIALEIIDLYKVAYPELENNNKLILEILAKEESTFRKTLVRGLREFTKFAGEKIDGKTIFTLFDTYGFPAELSIEDAKRHKIAIQQDWQQEFDRLMNEQRERSRTTTAGAFKGGLVDHEPDTLKHHTATHLMAEAMRIVLGHEIVQRGANVSSERLRFDFESDAKLTDDQKHAIEEIVNEQIQKDLRVWFEEHPKAKAFELGAKGAFGDKYGEVVKVYFMGKEGEEPFSIEICGGPHVENTSGIGKFKIKKEESSSAGVRRIKAKLE
jgi:alanyl-tRNA synthetase